MSDTPSIKLEKLERAHNANKICEDFREGAIAVLETDEYLPVWSGESNEAYKLRKVSTAFPNMYAPIVSGVTGLVTKKEPSREEMDDFDFDNVDGQGQGLNSFIRDVCDASISNGIHFITAQSKVDKGEVFLKDYSYKDLMSYSIVDDVVEQIVFKEVGERQKGEFGIEEYERYVVFTKDGGQVWYAGKDGKLERKKEWVNNLGEVAVSWVQTGIERSKFEVVSKMRDVALLNRVLLNNESQLANVLSVVGNPVPVFYGEMPEEGGVTIGVHEALTFEDKATQGFEYVEVSGNGVGKLQDKIEKIGKDIDKLGFSLLHKSDSRTVIDAQESQSKNTSFLTDVAMELESAFNKCYYMLSVLNNKPLSDVAGLEFKKEFDDVLFSDSQLKMLYEMLESGHLSRETFWDKLKSANILPKDFDADIEKERIEGDGSVA